MSVHVSSWVWRSAECEGNELLILLALADYANDEGVCWPGILSLSERCRCSTRTIQYNLRKAVKRGDLQISGRVTSEGDSDTNLYRFVKYSREGGGADSAGGGAKSQKNEIAPKPSVQPLVQPSDNERIEEKKNIKKKRTPVVLEPTFTISSPVTHSSVTESKPIESRQVFAYQPPPEQGVLVLERPLPTPGLPSGMPAFACVRTFVIGLGLPESDAEHIWNLWLNNGFTLKNNKSIKDWRANIRVKVGLKSLPSQRIKASIPGTPVVKAKRYATPEPIPEISEEELKATRDIFRKFREEHPLRNGANGSTAH